MSFRDDLKAKAEDLEIQREFKAISFRNRNITKAFSMKLEAEGVGGKVPIFTVSSQEYQFLQGRFVGCSKRFPDDNGTQIPALRDHLKSQAIERRVHMAQTFLEFTVEPIIRQIEVLYEMDQAGLTEKLRFSGERLLQVETQRLEEALRSGKEETMRQISESVKDLIDVIADGEAKATESSKSVVGSWSTKGGEHRMAFMTFKATIGRGGVYKPQNRDINLNAQFMKNVVESVEPLRPDFIAQRCINDWSEAGVKVLSLISLYCPTSDILKLMCLMSRSSTVSTMSFVARFRTALESRVDLLLWRSLSGIV